jgi:Spy/CpxP family protein refolding chaperone
MRLCKLALVLGVVALLASPALAQRGRGGFGGFGGPGFLLRVEKVQKDLGLEKDQVTKAEEALTKVREDHREDMQKLFDQNTSQEDRDAIRKKLAEANDKALKEVLSEKQMKRLKQIEHQQQGVDMFNDEHVQKALKLTDEQKTKIKEINDDLRKEMREMFSGGGKPGPETFTKIQGLRKDALASATKVLTDDQKKQLKELTGEPLELKPEDFPRGGKPGGKPRTDF